MHLSVEIMGSDLFGWATIVHRAITAVKIGITMNIVKVQPKSSRVPNPAKRGERKKKKGRTRINDNELGIYI